MSNVNESLNRLLKEKVIYNFEQDGEFIFMTVDYKGECFLISEELLIDESADGRTFSLVGTSDPLCITVETVKNYSLGLIFVNEINQSLVENRLFGQWSCLLSQWHGIDEKNEVIGRLSFQYVLTVPKDMTTDDLSDMIKRGIDSYKQTLVKVEEFLFKAERSRNQPLNVDDVFPQHKQNVQVSFHPALLYAIDGLDHEEDLNN